MNTTIPNRCEELVRLHGGLRKAAESCDIDVGYFSRLKSGEKDNPTAETLRKLGLTKTVVYQYATPLASAPASAPEVTEEAIARVAMQMLRDRFPERTEESLRESFRSDGTRDHWMHRARKAVAALQEPRHG